MSRERQDSGVQRLRSHKRAIKEIVSQPKPASQSPSDKNGKYEADPDTVSRDDTFPPSST